ncbi:Geranylgeranyl transferase type-2 subunit alpha [Tolypocladium ophioglossoides CBS 100239]|uniref:Geranylgeranyl transferase type-2 subunit alpha n=1 Tax=Tolypocladium ophioglossoides (strain CBS 100239) TaxID=1163406 RepID=A0A0L0NG07_TOLOC|nr:Geranylgeranyl transferase type-2 subunit alpha [Tolypocladium ophioglossoides CBS 100239]
MASHGVTRTAGARTEEQRQRDRRKIKKYRDLENQIRTHEVSGTYDHVLLQLTAELLRLNPEYYTIWNVRRRCLTSSLLTKQSSRRRPNVEGEASEDEGHESDVEVLKAELAFTIPLLMGFPKCYWIWDSRQWILSQAILRLTVPAARDIWETELGLTSMMLNKDQRNFHAWGYRRIVVAKLESPELRGKSMAEDEFAYTTKMIRRDLSNFSAWHNRSQIIPRLLQERGADPKMRAAFLVEELSLVRGGLNVGPEDQSLWYYHQFLIS